MKEEKKENNDNIVYCILKNNLKIIPIKKLPFIIGRKDNCDLFINNPSISKKHAIIQFDEQDEGSLSEDVSGIIERYRFRDGEMSGEDYSTIRKYAYDMQSLIYDKAGKRKKLKMKYIFGLV